MDADTGECSFGDGFYQSLLNDSPVGFALVSTDGRWLRVNRAISRLLGYSTEELSKLNFQKLTHPDALQARSEESPVGNERASPCRSRGSTNHKKKKPH